MLSSLSAPQRTHRFAALGLAVLLLLTAALASTPAQAAPLAQSYPGTVEWNPEPQIVSNGRRSGFPRVAVDANNITHVIYATEGGSIMYTNNRTGVFDLGGKALAGASYDNTPNVSIAAGPNNTIHAVYARPGNNNRVYYRFSPDGGVTWQDQVSLSDSKAWNPDIAIDPATGDAHIVWIDNRCGDYNVYYRVRRANGTLSGTQAPRSECGSYQNRPSITFAGSKPHVVYYKGGEVNYTRLDGGGWIKPVNISNTSTTSQNQSITSDGDNGIFVVWDENTNGHDIRFRASFDGGRTWTNAIPISDSKEWASHPYAAWSPSAKRVHVVWSDRTGSDDGQEEIWERQFDPATLRTTDADQVTHFNGHSFWPAISANTARADIVWHDNVDDTYQIWDWGGKVTGGTPITGCKGTLNLNGETIGTAKVSRSRTIAGTITPEPNCTPDQMQVAVNAPVTDATPKVAYNPNISVQAGDGCAQTVNVRLFRGGVGADPFSASVIVDTGTDAAVWVTNPHMTGTPAFPGTPEPGATNGDPNYTRETRFFLSVADAGDCVGLDTYNITGGDSGLITDGSATAWPDLPSVSAGLKTMVVNVTDKLGNKLSVEKSIIYDPTPPVLDTGASPSATAPLSTSSILVPISFDNIEVTDNEYGPREGLPGDAEFWGVVVANSTTNVSINSPTLNWLPAEVSADNTFTLTWSLLGGLDNPPDRATGGDVYIYVRFVDGAGNISANGITVGKVTLEPNYDLPSLQLPIIHVDS